MSWLSVVRMCEGEVKRARKCASEGGSVRRNAGQRQKEVNTAAHLHARKYGSFRCDRLDARGV